MELSELIQRFSDSNENRSKAIFSTLFIAGNKLQTLFDQHIPQISLKQFMLLTMIRQSKQQLTFTQLAKLLGCSRQNIKKLAIALEKKGFVQIRQSEQDARALIIQSTEMLEDYFDSVFSIYQQDLHYLFDVYSEDEIQQLFYLMMKLYAGIENLERNCNDEKK